MESSRSQHSTGGGSSHIKDHKKKLEQMHIESGEPRHVRNREDHSSETVHEENREEHTRRPIQNVSREERVRSPRQFRRQEEYHDGGDDGGNGGRFTKLAVICVLAVLAVIIIAAALHKSGTASGAATASSSGAASAEVKVDPKQDLLSKAELKADMYDYDSALDMIKSYSSDYASDSDLNDAVTKYESAKASCTAYPTDQITHIFFHVLIVDPSVAFSDSCTMKNGLNIYMATVSEFNKIMQSMYDKGFVLVTLQDVAPAVTNSDGSETFQPGQIMLPPGKKPFVLSQDDVCYYHAYENCGLADKLLIDGNGDIKAEYKDTSGNVSVGDYDMVPLLDSFVKEHPDFSYHGAKGIIALTGYNGILGYRTDPTYNTTQDRDSHEQKWLNEHPDFDYNKECEDAKTVAAAMKDDGWQFASHSWGHMWMDKISDSTFNDDAAKWMDRVYPLVGGTDIWIYPNGQDVDNDRYAARFATLRSYGFHYFCPVNSQKYSLEIKSDYVKMGRRNIDGYRMYYDMIDDSKDRLSDLFDVNQVFDTARPVPVPEI